MMHGICGRRVTMQTYVRVRVHICVKNEWSGGGGVEGVLALRRTRVSYGATFHELNSILSGWVDKLCRSMCNYLRPCVGVGFE